MCACIKKRGRKRGGNRKQRERKKRKRQILIEKERSTGTYRILTKVRGCLATDPQPMKVKCQACSLSDWPDKGANGLAWRVHPFAAVPGWRVCFPIGSPLQEDKAPCHEPLITANAHPWGRGSFSGLDSPISWGEGENPGALSHSGFSHGGDKPTPKPPLLSSSRKILCLS